MRFIAVFGDQMPFPVRRDANDLVRGDTRDPQATLGVEGQPVGLRVVVELRDYLAIARTTILAQRVAHQTM